MVTCQSMTIFFHPLLAAGKKESLEIKQRRVVSGAMKGVFLQ